MRLAASSTARCLLTDWRAISRCEHSSPRVWPLRSFRLSSSRRRLGSASALNASSIEGDAAIWLHILGIRMAACQASRRVRRHGAQPIHGDGPLLDRCDRTGFETYPRLSESSIERYSGSYLLLASGGARRSIAEAALCRSWMV